MTKAEMMTMVVGIVYQIDGSYRALLGAVEPTLAASAGSVDFIPALDALVDRIRASSAPAGRLDINHVTRGVFSLVEQVQNLKESI